MSSYKVSLYFKVVIVFFSDIPRVARYSRPGGQSGGRVVGKTKNNGKKIRDKAKIARYIEIRMRYPEFGLAQN